MADNVKISILGGLDEEGKNLNVVEINNDIFVVQCGVMIPDKTLPGIDYVIPRIDYLIENKERIKAYFLLHGHDDEVGALAYIYDQVPAPIYGSKATLTMLKIFTKHVKKDPSMYKFVEVQPSSTFTVAERKISYFHTAHNIVDSSGIAIQTSLGNIVFTGDFVVENSANPSYLHDIAMISRIAEEPTLALLSDSTYAGRSGYTAPLYKLTSKIEHVFKNSEGRIFVAVKSSNLYNIEEVIELTKKYRKKILWYDAATATTIDAMQQIGHLQIPRDNYAPIGDIVRLRNQDIVVLVTGFGSNLYRKIALLASGNNDDKRISLIPEDTFIIAAPSSDLTEVEYTDAADELYRCGCEVLNISKKEFLRMHASEEDLKTLACLFKPKYYIPIKGFYKELLDNAMLALSMGLNLSHSNVFVAENGDTISLTENGGVLEKEKVIHGDLMIDGGDYSDISEQVIKERNELEDGVIILAMQISRVQHKIIAGPDVQIRGFLYSREADMVIRETSKSFVTIVEQFLENEGPYNLEEIQQNVSVATLKVIRKLLGKEPEVIVLIDEI
ncbi:MAG: ribonuclease J [Bacilli bacterium]|nr:ribonuclease J [Bacilli bacterium]MDY6430195.1 ribonuclease J [Bacilli bacterium]